MEQHGMRQVSYDTVVGNIRTHCRVLDVRPIKSLGSLMDSRCNVHFTKNRCWISTGDGKELDMFRSGGVFFVAARPSKSLSSREANTLELNPLTAAEVEQAALTREHVALGTPVLEQRWTTMESPQCVSRFPQALRRPQLKKERCTKLQDMGLIEAGVKLCIATRGAGKPHLMGQQPDSDEAVPRIEFDFADRGQEEDEVLPILSLNAADVGSETFSSTLSPTKAFNEHVVETILTFVEAVGHNVVMLHSDQEPVVVQRLKAVQSRRVKRILMRDGPRATHQSQGKIENANRVVNGVCRSDVVAT